MQILLRTVNWIEGIVVPDMPTYRHCRLRCLYRFVDCGIVFAETVSKKHLPRSQFGILQQDSPELNVVAIHRALAAAR